MHAEGQGFESLYLHFGSVAERFKALVLKTSVGKPTVSSNLTASAIYNYPAQQKPSVTPEKWGEDDVRFVRVYLEWLPDGIFRVVSSVGRASDF